MLYTFFKMRKIVDFFEDKAFGVCSRLGEKLGLASSSIRLFFIYSSFLTFGSPIILYLILAFIMNIRKHLRRRRNLVWYWSKPQTGEFLYSPQVMGKNNAFWINTQEAVIWNAMMLISRRPECWYVSLNYRNTMINSIRKTKSDNCYSVH